MLLHRCTPPVQCLTVRSTPSITRRSAPVAALNRPCCALPSVGFSSSSFAGSSLRLARPGARQQQGVRLVVQANGKHSMGATGGGTRRKRTRKSGFRARIATVGGRKVLQARRKKGRHELCPAHSRGKTRK